VLAYGYSRGTLIDYAVFYDYTIINKSTDNYNNMRMAIWSDVDMGYFLDDYVAVDSARRMGIVYNATNDDGVAAGHPEGSYGANPPAAGITILRFPGDMGSALVPMGSFVSYENSSAVNGNPTSTVDFNYYMHGQRRDGIPFPVIDDTWDECATGNPAGDRRIVQTTGDFSLAAGAKTHIVMALVVDSSAGGCPTMDLSGVKTVADTARNIFNNPPPVLGMPERYAMTGGLRLYPNPAGNTLHVATGAVGGMQWQLTVVDCMGRTVYMGTHTGNDATIPVDVLPAGVYGVRCTAGAHSQTGCFVKE
jgi:hypothetical protein